MPTKFCPHWGKRTGFQVRFNITRRIGDEEEKGYLREWQEFGGRFITIQKDEQIKETKRRHHYVSSSHKSDPY